MEVNKPSTPKLRERKLLDLPTFDRDLEEIKEMQEASVIEPSDCPI